MNEHLIITPRSEVRRDLLDRPVRSYTDSLVTQIQETYAQHKVHGFAELRALAVQKRISESEAERLMKLYRQLAQAVRENKMPPEAERCTIADAERILNGWVFGPEDVQKVFGVYVDQDEAEIPYTRTQLEQAREEGAMLVYRISEDVTGEPLTLQRIYHELQNHLRVTGGAEWITTSPDGASSLSHTSQTIPRSGWRIVTRNPVSKTIGRDYFGQTKILRQFLEQRGILTDAEARESSKKILEKERKEYSAFKRFNRTHLSVAESAVSLPVNAVHRRSAGELLYDIGVSYFSKGKLLLSAHSEDTTTLTKGGTVLGLGLCREDGGRLVINARTSFLDENMLTTCACTQW